MVNEKNEQIAVFRFGVIHEFVGGATLTRDETLFVVNTSFVPDQRRDPT